MGEQVGDRETGQEMVWGLVEGRCLCSPESC